MNTILLPIDFSAATDRAVDFVANFAAQLETEVCVLHVSEAGLNDPKQGKTVLAPKLDTVVKQLETKGCKASAHLTDGSPVPAILEKIDELCPTLVVMGSHGHTAMYNLIMGSVTYSVLRSGKCPVLIVPPPPKERGPSQEMTAAGLMDDFYGFPGM